MLGLHVGRYVATLYSYDAHRNVRFSEICTNPSFHAIDARNTAKKYRLYGDFSF